MKEIKPYTNEREKNIIVSNITIGNKNKPLLLSGKNIIRIIVIIISIHNKINFLLNPLKHKVT